METRNVQLRGTRSLFQKLRARTCLAAIKAFNLTIASEVPVDVWKPGVTASLLMLELGLGGLEK